MTNIFLCLESDLMIFFKSSVMKDLCWVCVKNTWSLLDRMSLSITNPTLHQIAFCPKKYLLYWVYEYEYEFSFIILNSKVRFTNYRGFPLE